MPNRRLFLSLPALLVAAGLLASLLPVLAEAQSCTPYREWRYAVWYLDECCRMEYPPGYYSYYKTKARQLQYRDRDPYCNWSAWKNSGDTQYFCSNFNPGCPVWASLPEAEGEAPFLLPVEPPMTRAAAAACPSVSLRAG